MQLKISLQYRRIEHILKILTYNYQRCVWKDYNICLGILANLLIFFFCMCELGNYTTNMHYKYFELIRTFNLSQLYTVIRMHHLKLALIPKVKDRKLSEFFI